MFTLSWISAHPHRCSQLFCPIRLQPICPVRCCQWKPSCGRDLGRTGALIISFIVRVHTTKAQVKPISLMRAEFHQLSQLAMTVRRAQLNGMQSDIRLSTLPGLFLLWQANISTVTKVYCTDLSLHWLKLTQPYSESVTSNKTYRETKQQFEKQLGSTTNSGVACLKVTFCRLIMGKLMMIHVPKQTSKHWMSVQRGNLWQVKVSMIRHKVKFY